MNIWYVNIRLLYISYWYNKLEGSFTDLKNKLRNHNGLSIKRRKKFIDGFLKESTLKVFNKKG